MYNNHCRCSDSGFVCTVAGNFEPECGVGGVCVIATAPTPAPATFGPTPSPSVCGTGTVLTAGVCEAIITSCSEGNVLTAGVCQATILTCAEGTTYDGVGRRCVPDWGHCYGVRKHWGPGADNQN